ncbi:hypothetical protein ACTWP5_14660 [Streptomyces sp. 4N509B]|uniref:hypothetical protein n=1 Tax=Streptomyces sp. 4N509B TaxID=3457413 RepID=UPI003FD1B8F7
MVNGDGDGAGGGGPAGAGDGRGEDDGEAAAPPTAPFTQRVLVLVEVVDEPGELALARDLLAGRGWPVRDAAPDETPPPPPGPTSDGAGPPTRRALVVEVRLNGARWRAERAAKGAVTVIARRRKLALWVRDATLLSPPREDRTTYRVVRRATGGPLPRLWARLGGRDAHRVLGLPTRLTREAVERELTDRRLGRDRFATADHELLPPPPETEEEAARRTTEPVPLPTLVLAAAALLGALAGGYWLWWADGLTLGVPLVMLLLAAAVFAAFPWREPLRLAARVAVGPLLAAGCALLGWMLADAQSDTGTEPVDQLLMIGAVSLGMLSLAGVWLALRQTWVSRNAVWLVPVAVPVAGSMVAWLGRLMRAVYLEAFDIPAGSVRSVESLWDYAAAGRPLGIALAFVLLFTGALGWARHVYFARGDNRVYAIVATLLASLVYALTAVGLGVDAAHSAAERAMAEAGDGRNPAPYFGLRGGLMCVHPVGAEPIAVENGPVPTGHPVLSFGSSEEWVWLWDPARAARSDVDASDTFAVRRDDVRLVPPGGDGECDASAAGTDDRAGAADGGAADDRAGAGPQPSS